MHFQFARRRILCGLIVLAVAAMFWLWDTAVIGNHWMSFYGQVVDPGGHGLPDVGVQIEVETGDFLSPPFLFVGGNAHPRQFSVFTDKNGNFELQNFRGKGIIIKDFKKVGYYIFHEGEPYTAIEPPSQYYYNDRRYPIPSDPSKRAVYNMLVEHSAVDGK